MKVYTCKRKFYNQQFLDLNLKLRLYKGNLPFITTGLESTSARLTLTAVKDGGETCLFGSMELEWNR